LQEDLSIREFINKKLRRRALVGRVLIERAAKSIKVTLFTARPGVIIGKKGEGIEQVKADLQKLVKVPLHLNVEEIRKPELNAQIVADQIAMQIEKRVAFRRAMKRAMQASIKMGAIGVKVMTSGRLNGVDIARSEWYREGRVPLHTLRADVDYSTSEAFTTYGIVGIKVWVYKGDRNLSESRLKQAARDEEQKVKKGAPKPQGKKHPGKGGNVKRGAQKKERKG
jgi:small subunit ribosomal protein S3